MRWMKGREAKEKQPNELWWDASVEEVIKSPGMSQDSYACTHKCFQRPLSNHSIHLSPWSYLLLVFTSVSLHSPLLLFNSSLSIPLHLVSLLLLSLRFLFPAFDFHFLSQLSRLCLPQYFLAHSPSRFVPPHLLFSPHLLPLSESPSPDRHQGQGNGDALLSHTQHSTVNPPPKKIQMKRLFFFLHSVYEHLDTDVISACQCACMFVCGGSCSWTVVLCKPAVKHSRTRTNRLPCPRHSTVSCVFSWQDDEDRKCKKATEKVGKKERQRGY